MLQSPAWLPQPLLQIPTSPTQCVQMRLSLKAPASKRRCYRALASKRQPQRAPATERLTHSEQALAIFHPVSSTACIEDVVAVLVDFARYAFPAMDDDAIEEAARTAVEGEHWEAAVLEVLGRLVNLMVVDKEGKTKRVDDLMSNMQGCQASRDIVLGRTEPSELSVEMVNECFLHWVTNFLMSGLSYYQWHTQALRPRWDWDGRLKLTTEQRSLVANVLRYRVGHKRVAFTIWQLGLPSLLLPKGAGASHHWRHLHSSLAEAAAWLSRVAAAWQLREQTVDFLAAARLGGSTWGVSPLTREDHCRKEQLQCAKADRSKGKRLREHVNYNARAWDDLGPDEQSLLSSYDTGELDDACTAYKRSRPGPWRV